LNVFEPETFDPGLCETIGSAEIINNLFEGLVELDTELNVIPALARRWRVDSEGKLFRFELRPNLKWSDGAPLTAYDFVFAWRRNLVPETGAGVAHQLYVVEGAEDFHQGRNPDPNSIAISALDDLNLEVILKTPTPYFPYLLTSSISFPQPAHLIETKGDDWNKPPNLVCNGPFRIMNWQPNQEMRLEKNSFYRGFAPGNLGEVLLYFAEPSLEQYIRQEIDWCPVWDQADLAIRYPTETFLVQYLTTYFLAFSCRFPPFNQKLVRQAFAMSINQQEVVKTVWSNVQKPALGGVVPPGMPGHSPEIGLYFDPRAARQLLKQAGFDSGASLPSLTLAALSGFRTTPDYLQASWREHLGVEVQIMRNMSLEDIAAKMKQGSAQLSLSGWGVDYPDPDDMLRVLFHGASPTNYLGWHNQQFDQLVERAASLTDQQVRLTLYHQADRLLVAEETAIVPLYYQQAHGLLRPGFRLEGAGKIIRGGTLKFKNIRAA
jgi:oligopeptide transport system substrate-binding protein